MNKTCLPFLLAAIAAATAPAHAKLTAHEWGTFTVLQAPDGTTVRWYLEREDIAPLPPFVIRTAQGIEGASKFGTSLLFRNGRIIGSQPYAVRMETPVLYFYPDAPMDVQVAVRFPEGEITEYFPNAVITAEGVCASWKGSLLKATPDALLTVPDASGPPGRHYAAARAVPDAWLFRTAGPDAPASPAPTGTLLLPPAPPPLPPQTDHFIFYRGAGNNVPMQISVVTKDDHTFTLRNNMPETVPVLFLLRVADGKAAWTRVDNLPSHRLDFSHPLGPQLKPAPPITLPEAAEPLPVATDRLKTDMLAALEKEGLTKAEAAAMVATWDTLWFEEPGTRVLALLPQKWVDAALPLQITPQPESLDRVFVARLELISVVQQNTLATLLDRNPDDPAAAREQMRQLALGRFAPGAIERAVALKSQEMRTRFAQLSRPEPAKETSSAIPSSRKPEDLKAIREGMKRVVESGSTVPATQRP